jgi:hypothetical protein
VGILGPRWAQRHSDGIFTGNINDHVLSWSLFALLRCSGKASSKPPTRDAVSSFLRLLIVARWRWFVQFNTRDVIGLTSTDPLGVFWTSLETKLKSQISWNTPQCQASVGPQASGSYTSSTSLGLDGNLQRISSGSCGATPSTPGHIVVVDIGPVSAGPGGSVTFDTCTAAEDWDTVLYVGAASAAACPGFGAWSCVGSNDDACGPRGVQSQVTVPVTGKRYYPVFVTGLGGATGVYTLTWKYSPPSQSSTATATRTKTAAKSRSSSATATRSKTATRTRV